VWSGKEILLLDLPVDTSGSIWRRLLVSSRESATLYVLQCTLITELVDPSLGDSQNIGHFIGAQQKLAL
jgi:hypothetical protein